MLVTVMHENGKLYQMRVSQVVVYAENGEPCAISYEHGGLIVHTDITKSDFKDDVISLNVKNIDVDA